MAEVHLVSRFLGKMISGSIIQEKWVDGARIEQLDGSRKIIRIASVQIPVRQGIRPDQ